MNVSQSTRETIDRIAKERGLARSGLVLQALGIMQTMHDAAKGGLYVGVTEHRDRLDTVLVAPLV